MSRQAERDERRRRIAEAVCVLADEHGMDGVTLRDVAIRANVSMGAVQRCFRTKEEMLAFALGHVGERIVERINSRFHHSSTSDPADRLAAAAAAISLLDHEHRAEARVWLAFLAQAAVSPRLAAVLQRDYASLEGMVERIIATGVPIADARREARTLLALADGLTAHVLVGHLTADAAGEALHAHLARLVGSSDHAAPRGPDSPA